MIKIGRRLAMKVLNAAKFVLAMEGTPGEVTERLDREMLAELATVVRAATRAFEAYDHAKALEVTEAFFWTFCDDYLELVKERAYSGDDARRGSAIAALRQAIDVQLRLLAPFLPFATEEVWSWSHEGSIHHAAWPTPDELGNGSDASGAGAMTTGAISIGATGMLATVGQALIGIRRAKTDAKASQKTPVASAVVAVPAALREHLESAADDLKAVGRIRTLTLVEADELAVGEIVLEEG